MIEEELRKSEKKYRTLFETMAQGVVYQNADGSIMSVNPAAERILSLTLDQMLGRTSMDPRWKSVHEDGSDFPGETHPAMVALKTGKKVKDVVMGVFNSNKEDYTWIKINAVPEYKEGEDKPFQVYTTFDDITEQKKAEQEKEKLLHDYGERVKELTGLYSLGELATQTDDLEDLFYRFTKDIVPPSMQFPDKTIGVIELDKKKYLSKKEELVVKLSAPIIVGGEQRGTLSIGYSKNLLFIPEFEQRLIDAYAERLGKIIESEKAKEALRKSVEKYRTLFETSSDAIMILEPPDWKFTKGNPATIKMFETKDEREFVSLRPWELSSEYQLGGKTSDERAKEMIKKAMEEGRNFFEWTHKRHNGGEFPATVLLSRITEHGKTYLQATVRDITEQKKEEEEEELRNLIQIVSSERDKFNYILSQLPVGVTVLDEKDKIIYINDISLKLDGNNIDRDGLFGKDVREVCSKSVLSKIDEIFRDFKSGKYSSFTSVARRGKRIVGFFYHAIRIDGKYKGMIWLVEDITEKKKAEEKLRLSDDILRTIGTLVLVTNSKSEVVYCSPSVKKLIGYDTKEVLGDGWWELTFDNKKQVEKVKYLLARISNGKNADEGEHYERKVTCRDGSKKCFFWYNSKGPDDLVIAVGHDITLQKSSEKKIRALNRIKTISKNREEKIRALSMIKGMEKERTRVSRELHDGLGQVLTAMKHEFGRYRKSFEEQGMDYSKGYNIKALIENSITAVRKISNDLMPSVLNDFGLKAALRKMTGQFSNDPVKVEFICHGEFGRLSSDVELGLFRIAQEGVTNAVNHSKARQIRLLLKKQDNIISLLVQDDGNGFDVEEQLNYFSGIKGHGITNMRERARLMNGKFHLISKPGKGTKIEINLLNPSIEIF